MTINWFTITIRHHLRLLTLDFSIELKQPRLRARKLQKATHFPFERGIEPQRQENWERRWPFASMKENHRFIYWRGFWHEKVGKKKLPFLVWTEVAWINLEEVLHKTILTSSFCDWPWISNQTSVCSFLPNPHVSNHRCALLEEKSHTMILSYLFCLRPYLPPP